MKKALFILAFLLVEFTSTAQSQSAFPWMRIGRDAVSLGMAGADFIGTDNTAWAAFDNVAAVSLSEDRLSAAVSYLKWNASSTAYTSAGVSAKLGEKIGVSAAFSLGSGEPFNIYDAYGHKGKPFTPGSMQGNLGLSYRLKDYLSVGLVAKYASESLAPKLSYSVFAADLMAMAKLGALSVAGGIASLGTPVKNAKGESFPLPASFRLGGSYDMGIGQDMQAKAFAAADVYFYGAASAALGAKLSFRDFVNVRAGYNLSVSSPLPSYASLGLGVKFSGLSFDLAYLLGNKAMANTLCLSLGYAF